MPVPVTSDALPEPPLAPYAGWLEEACKGNPAARAIMEGCLRRFLRRNGCMVIENPCPRYRWLLRIYRAAAVITEHGTVRTTDMFRIPALDSFWNHAAVRESVITTTSWDDKATLFFEHQPPPRLRETPSVLDFDGTRVISTVGDQIRMFNLLLANDLERYACPGPWEPSGPDDRFALCETVGEGLSQCLTRVLAEEVPRLLLAFRASMDQGKLHVLADCRANSVRAYNWLFGMEQGSITAGLGKKRLQAATAYPVAWPLISMTTGPVCDAIGEPQPLIPALAKTLGTTERVVRLLNGLSAESAGVVGMPTLGDLERIVAQMDLMPQGSAPRTPNGRMSFLRIIPLAALVAGIRYRRATKENITEVLSTCGDAWDTLVPDEITSAAACFSDAISDLSDQVVAPAERNRFGLIGEEALVDTGKIFVGERGIAAILKACLWWQEHRMELHAHLAGRHPSPFRDAGSSTNQWPPLHKGPPWKTSTDLLIQALCSDAELKREAAVMSHCVDNYAQSCLWTGVHIVSVRGIDGVPIATAEFDPGILSLAGKQPDLPNSMITELPPCVRQFRGRQNNEPPRLAWQALWEYVGGLCAGRIPVDSKELAADLERRQRAKRRLHTQFSGGDVALDLRCVYDAMSTEGILEAWRCYGPMLPRNTARRGPWRAIENARASRNPVAASTPSNELPVDPDANADRPIPRAA